MNNDTIKENEFVLRRLGESFPQFMLDLWSAVPLWLLILTVVALAARVGYVRHYRKTRGPAKLDDTAYWLWWAACLSVIALVVTVLVRFYVADTRQMEAATPALSAFAGSNTVLWYAFVGTVFGLGTVYVVLMYIKDSRSVRWYWAANLAILRICVYAVLCFVFLLPARQTWERTEKKSRVVVLIDITPSMFKPDDTGINPPRRMDVLIKFLTDKDIAFVQNLLKTNPVAVYPFGTRLDETPQIIDRSEQPWGKDEWEALARYDFRPFLLKGLSDAAKDALRNTDTWSAGNAGSPDWASAWFARKDEQKLVNGMSDADTATLREN